MRGKHEEKKRREEEERRMQGWAVYGAMEELKKKNDILHLCFCHTHTAGADVLGVLQRACTATNAGCASH
jgi:hypothetical protein